MPATRSVAFVDVAHDLSARDVKVGTPDKNMNFVLRSCWSINANKAHKAWVAPFWAVWSMCAPSSDGNMIVGKVVENKISITVLKNSKDIKVGDVLTLLKDEEVQETIEKKRRLQ